MVAMRKKERGQRLLRSSRVLRRVRVFEFATPRSSSRTKTWQTGKALDMADIGHLRDVADLM